MNAFMEHMGFDASKKIKTQCVTGTDKLQMQGRIKDESSQISVYYYNQWIYQLANGQILTFQQEFC